LRESLLFLQTTIGETPTKIIVPQLLPTVVADAVRIGEVFTNLISNAIKYNNKTERKIEIGYNDNPLPTIAGEPRYERIFYIRDNGIGIESRHHNDIFRIFKRLHGRNAYSGVGAGLTIVKKIIERHGGRIWLESVPNEGTIIYFTIE
jgi:light-regulated signal transduction histidine kinase (bacteriophytochrome)